MKPSHMPLLLMLVAGIGCSVETSGDSCPPGTTLECLCTDGASGQQECTPEGNGFVAPCNCGNEEESGEEAGEEAGDEAGEETEGGNTSGDESGTGSGTESGTESETGGESTGTTGEDTGNESGVESGEEACPDDFDYFVEEIWGPILSIQCTGCHNAEGPGSQSQLVLQPIELPGAMEENFDTLSTIALTEYEGTSLLLLKPTGLHPDGHAGGPLVPVGSLNHARLVEFAGRVSGVLDPCADPSPPDECMGELAGRRLLRRLTRFEYDNTIQDLLGIESQWGASFTPEDVINGFDNAADANAISALFADQVRKASEEVASLAVQDLNTLVDCSPSTKEEQLACSAEFIASFGKRAFRRPLEADEVERYGQLYQVGRALDDYTSGIELIVSGMLQSPHFLYRAELGTHAGEGVWTLSPHEVATQLSYFFWGTMPDDALFAAAEDGSLATDEGLLEEVNRLLDDPRRNAMIAHFSAQWLDVTGLSYAPKDPELFPEFTEEIRSAMEGEFEQFMASVVFEATGNLSELFLSETTHMRPELATFLNLPEPDDIDESGSGEVSLTGSPRKGLLTLAAVLATHAFSNGSSPIHRGMMVRERLLCQELPPPPPGIVANPPPVDPTLTTRERFAEHSSVEPCFSCHKLIDPIGFGMENFDAVGRYRDTENGLPIDSMGEITGAPLPNTFDGALELADMLAESPDIHACHVKQWFRYGLGVEDDQSVACLLDSLESTFTDSGTHIPTLLSAIATSPHVRMRYDAVPEEGWDTPSPPLTLEIPEPANGGLEVNDENIVVGQELVSSWAEGYCSDVTVSNVGDYPIAWVIQLNIDGEIYNLWNATMTPAGTAVEFQGPTWQKELQGGESITFGFCANL